MKTRFAPSPTGYIHLGNMRTALFNALIAYHQQGSFLVRIEDTDKERSKDEYIHALFEDLAWLGLESEKAEQKQSERGAIYDEYYDKLKSESLAYPCFCTDEQLKLERKLQLNAGRPPRYSGKCKRLTAEQVQALIAEGKPHTLRFKVDDGAEVKFTDLVQGDKVFKTDDIGDFIIQRQDGSPTFMYCNAIDDSLMGVTHAFRGEDHLTNTPRQLLILQALNMRAPQYGHFALINGVDGAPLSKRNGSQSIQSLREQGYWPLAVLNYLARLGHYYDDNRLMSLSELAEAFKVENLGRAPSRFDPGQLTYWQHEVFKTKTDEDVWEWMSDCVASLVPEDLTLAFTRVTRPNITLHQDAVEWAKRAFSDNLLADLNHELFDILKAAPADFFEAAVKAAKQHGPNFKAIADDVAQACGVKGKQLFQPLRIALMGTLNGPHMDEWVSLIGIERVVNRLEALCKSTTP